MGLYFTPDISKAMRVDEPNHFEGVVHVQFFVRDVADSDVSLGAVFFENGARSFPHTHDTDQVLIVTDGTCEVVDEKSHRSLEAGEVAVVTKGDWHWHGAAPNASTCHITVRKHGGTNWDVERKDWDQR